MNSWIYAILAILFVAAFPFFLLCWNLSQTKYRAIRHANPAIAEPPEYVIATLNKAIGELEKLGFTHIDYYQIERANINEEALDWGVLLYHQRQKVYAGVAISEHSGAWIPPINISLASFFADGGYLYTLNIKSMDVFSLPNSEMVLIQNLGFLDITQLWQAHEDKLQELSLSRVTLDLLPAEYIEGTEQNALNEMQRLVGTKEILWVEAERSIRFSWLVVLRMALINTPLVWANMVAAFSGKPIAAQPETVSLELEIAKFQEQINKPPTKISPKLQRWLLLGSLAMFVAVYATRFSFQSLFIFVGVLLFHEGGHVLAMKIFGYRDVTMLFIPFLGALATAKKEDASLTEKVLISLAGPFPGLVIGIGLAIAFSNENPLSIVSDNPSWIMPLSWTLIGLNLFNLLPVYPLDGGQIADLLLFSSNPYLGVLFKIFGVGILLLIGWQQPLFLVFALLIALSIPYSFQIAKLQNKLENNFRHHPPSDRTNLIQRIFESLQQPPYHKFAFAQKSNIAKSILDIQKEKSASWQTRLLLSIVYVVSLLGGMAGGLYAIVPSPKAWISMAQSLRYIGKDPKIILQEQMQEKVEAATRQLQTNPQDVKAYLDRGRAYIYLRNIPQALADANQVIKLDPKSADGYSLRGQIKRSQNDLKGSRADNTIAKNLTNQKIIAETTSTLKSNPKDINAYLMRATAKGQLGDNAKALADFDQALKLEPKNPQIFVARGQFYLEIKNYQKAIAEANQAIKLDAKSYTAYFLRSEVYRKLGDLNKAEADTRKADELELSGGKSDREAN
jgi:tetratricopeptide (TPR) repeat protein